MATQTPPCARCGTLGGIVWRETRPGQLPSRANGARYGAPGLLCFRCYQRAKRRATQRARAKRADRIKHAKQRAAVAAEARQVAAAEARRLAAQRPLYLGRPPAPEPPEAELRLFVPPRVAVVRAAKQAKKAAGMGAMLTDAELDRILPLGNELLGVDNDSHREGRGAALSGWHGDLAIGRFMLEVAR